MRGRLPQEPRLWGDSSGTYQRPTLLVLSARSGSRSLHRGTLAALQAVNRRRASLLAWGRLHVLHTLVGSSSPYPALWLSLLNVQWVPPS